MALPRLARILLWVAAAVVLLEVVGLLLFHAGGSEPPVSGRGDPVGYSRQP